MQWLSKTVSTRCSEIGSRCNEQARVRVCALVGETESTCCSEFRPRCNEYARIVDSSILRLVAAASLAVITASLKIATVRLSLVVASGHYLVTM